jgi:hypothetical protein
VYEEDKRIQAVHKKLDDQMQKAKANINNPASWMSDGVNQ